MKGCPRSACWRGRWISVVPAEIAASSGRLPGTRMSGRTDRRRHRPTALRPRPILRLLHQSSGVDFNPYKAATLAAPYRATHALHKSRRWRSMPSICGVIRQKSRRCFQDILINVPSVLRDPETFEVLKTRVFPRIEPPSMGPQMPFGCGRWGVCRRAKRPIRSRRLWRVNEAGRAATGPVQISRRI